ncbi:hypothetical protein VTJ04DRAFT_6582 [Mycothermus thermophilus]|uniref:uncharacterized protein n=1 Tax=Humicola insolens TaxID=85995 RepID=UPI0037440087
MTDATGKPEDTFYPQYCFHLSPTINRWCHLRIADIWALRAHHGFQGQDVYFHLNHPIKWVRIAGVVVAVDERETRHFYTIDDGSGATLECVVSLPPKAGTTITTAAAQAQTTTTTTATTTADTTRYPTIDAPIDVGHVLDIKGSVGTFRENRQIRADKIVHLRSTEQEVLFWEKIAQLRREVLCKPWILDPKVVRKCRKEEELRVRRLEEETESGLRSKRRHHAGRREDGEKVVRTGLEKRRRRQEGGEREEERTGLERKVRERDEEGRRTGLERRVKTTSSATAAAMDEGTRPERPLLATGLERKRPPGMVTGLEKKQSAGIVTGLEKKRPADMATGLEKKHPPDLVTGLEKKRPPDIITGLEKKRPDTLPSKIPDSSKTTPPPTGLERRKTSRSSASSLLRSTPTDANADPAPSSGPSDPTSRDAVAGSSSDAKPGVKTGLESRRKPLADKPAALVTGLEKKKPTRQFTRLVPVTGKFDALGL